MCEDILSVAKSLDHLSVGGLHGATQRIGTPLSLLVYIGNHLRFATEHDLSMILKVDLNNLI